MDEQQIIAKLKKLLGGERFRHCLRVRKKVLQLSAIYKVDPRKASLAGLLHDVSRYLDSEGLLKLAKKLKFRIDPISRKEPKLLHAALSAYIARKIFHVTDKGVLQAISSHTLGRKNMSKLEKIVYVADHTEEGRSHSSAKLAGKAAQGDLDKAIVIISGSMIKYLLDKGFPVHPGTYEVRNHYLIKHEQKSKPGQTEQKPR